MPAREREEADSFFVFVLLGDRVYNSVKKVKWITLHKYLYKVELFSPAGNAHLGFVFMLLFFILRGDRV